MDFIYVKGEASTTFEFIDNKSVCKDSSGKKLLNIDATILCGYAMMQKLPYKSVRISYG